MHWSISSAVPLHIWRVHWQGQSEVLAGGRSHEMRGAEHEEGVLLRVPRVEKRDCFPQVHRGERYWSRWLLWWPGNVSRWAMTMWMWSLWPALNGRALQQAAHWRGIYSLQPQASLWFWVCWPFWFRSALEDVNGHHLFVRLFMHRWWKIGSVVLAKGKPEVAASRCFFA